MASKLLPEDPLFSQHKGIDAHADFYDYSHMLPGDLVATGHRLVLDQPKGVAKDLAALAPAVHFIGPDSKILHNHVYDHQSGSHDGEGMAAAAGISHSVAGAFKDHLASHPTNTYSPLQIVKSLQEGYIREIERLMKARPPKKTENEKLYAKIDAKISEAKKAKDTEKARKANNRKVTAQAKKEAESKDEPKKAASKSSKGSKALAAQRKGWETQFDNQALQHALKRQADPESFDPAIEHLLPPPDDSGDFPFGRNESDQPQQPQGIDPAHLDNLVNSSLPSLQQEALKHPLSADQLKRLQSSAHPAVREAAQQLGGAPSPAQPVSPTGQTVLAPPPAVPTQPAPATAQAPQLPASSTAPTPKTTQPHPGSVTAGAVAKLRAKAGAKKAATPAPAAQPASPAVSPAIAPAPVPAVQPAANPAPAPAQPASQPVAKPVAKPAKRPAKAAAPTVNPAPTPAAPAVSAVPAAPTPTAAPPAVQPAAPASAEPQPKPPSNPHADQYKSHILAHRQGQMAGQAESPTHHATAAELARAASDFHAAKGEKESAISWSNRALAHDKEHEKTLASPPPSKAKEPNAHELAYLTHKRDEQKAAVKNPNHHAEAADLARKVAASHDADQDVVSASKWGKIAQGHDKLAAPKGSPASFASNSPHEAVADEYHKLINDGNIAHLQGNFKNKAEHHAKARDLAQKMVDHHISTGNAKSAQSWKKAVVGHNAKYNAAKPGIFGKLASKIKDTLASKPVGKAPDVKAPDIKIPAGGPQWTGPTEGGAGPVKNKFGKSELAKSTRKVVLPGSKLKKGKTNSGMASDGGRGFIPKTPDIKPTPSAPELPETPQLKLAPQPPPRGGSISPTQIEQPGQPKKPVGSLKIGKSVAGQLCPVCGDPNIRNAQFVGCVCYQSLAKGVKLIDGGNIYALVLDPELWDEDAVDSLASVFG